MSIKILIYEPYAVKLYGNTRYIMTIFKFLNKDRFTPLLVTPEKDDVLEMIRQLEGRYHILPPPKRLRRFGHKILTDGPWGKFLTGFALIKYTFALLSLLTKEEPEIIQCHNIRALITIGLAAKLKNCRMLWYIKGDLENRLLDRIGFSLANQILFQSEITKNIKYPKLINKFSKKIEILHNGVDLDEILTLQKKDHVQRIKSLGLSPGQLNIIFLGTLCPRKGLEYLIEAMVTIRERVQHIKLYLIGDHGVQEYIDYRKKLDQLITQNSLKNYVTFVGYRTDAIEILSLMDIFVLPALSEGVPKSIIEAMALAKPVVATRVGGVTELVKDGETGFVVEPKNSDALADAIITLLKNEELRTMFGRKAQEIAFSEYSIKKNIEGLEKIYSEMINAKQRG